MTNTIINSVALAAFSGIVVLSVSPVSAHEGYHSAGGLGTGYAASAQATITHHSLPARIGAYEHMLGQVSLFDPASGGYVQAGVGWTPGFEVQLCLRQNGRTALWYWHRDIIHMDAVGSVPLGTPVTVSVQKWPGTPVVLISWSWDEAGMSRALSRVVTVPGWASDGGIHTGKAQGYASGIRHPRLDFTFANTNISPMTDPYAFLGADYPYFFTPGSSVYGFGVYKKITGGSPK